MKWEGKDVAMIEARGLGAPGNGLPPPGGYLYRGRPGLEELNAQIMAARGPGHRGPDVDGWRHGTIRGYDLHKMNGQAPCETCHAAKSAQNRRYRERKARRKARREEAG
jgi:hypothetical protein